MSEVIEYETEPYFTHAVFTYLKSGTKIRKFGCYDAAFLHAKSQLKKYNANSTIVEVSKLWYIFERKEGESVE